MELDLESKIIEKYRDINLEEKVICFLLREDITLKNRLKEDCFTCEPLKIFYKILNEKNICLDIDSLESIINLNYKKKIEEMSLFLKRLYSYNLDYTEFILEYISLLNKYVQNRKMLNGIYELINKIDDFELESYRKKMSELVYETSDSIESENEDYFERIDKRIDLLKDKIEKKERDEIIGIPIGIPKFDNFSGGILNDEIMLIGGEPGVGKTIFLINIALNAYRKGKNVVFFEGEMLKDQLEFRMDSLISELLYEKFRTGEINNEELELLRNDLIKEKKKNDNFIQIEIFGEGTSIKDIEEKLYKIQDLKKKVVDVLIIDHINLLSSSKKITSKYLSQDSAVKNEIIRELYGLNKRFNQGKGLPIITVNHLTDDANKADNIKLKHFKYSRSYGEFASIVLALKQTDDDKLEGITKLQCIKFRGGKVFKPIPLFTDFSRMKIYNQEKEFSLED